MKIMIPVPSLVILIGASGSGKSAFARKHFGPSEIISSDSCRWLVSDDENNQDVSKDAFDLLYFIARKRLHNRRLVVIDSTNVRRDARKRLLSIAAAYGVAPIGIAFNLPKSICVAHNRRRRDRIVAPEVVERQWNQMKNTLESLRHEEFAKLYVLNSLQKIRATTVEKVFLISHFEKNTVREPDIC